MNSKYLLITLMISANYLMLFSQRQMEYLGRGVVAIHNEKNKISVSWRLLETDPDNIAFNLYRRSGSLSPFKLNDQPIIKSTFWADTTMNFYRPNEYTENIAYNQPPETGFYMGEGMDRPPHPSIFIIKPNNK